MNDYNPEYDDEAGMADNNLETLKRAVSGLDDLISAGDNLPEWCQEKIAVAKSMLVAVWDYMHSEEDRGAIAETKKSHKRPKYSIKPKSSVLPTFQPGGDKKKKKKKNGYFEHLESQLINKLDEYQDRMAGVGMGNYVVDKSPTEAVKPKSSVKCFRQGDEWVVQIKGTIVRIPTDEASSPEEAVQIAKSNLGMSEAREMSPALRAAQQNLINLKKAKLEKPEPKTTSVMRAKSDAAPKIKTSAKPKPTPVIAKGGQVHDPEMEKMMADYLAKGGKVKVGRAGKAPPAGRNQASKHIGGAGSIKRRGDRPGLGANYRGDKDVTVEGWTHDTLAARLFEQDITYEDQLNRALKRKLGK